jgi:hypothetical protein
MDDLFEEMYSGSKQAILFGIEDLKACLAVLENEIRKDTDLTNTFIASKWVKASMANVLAEVTVYEKCAKVLDMSYPVHKQQLNREF